MQFKVQCFYHTDEVPGYWRVFHHTTFETGSPFEAARVADGLNKAAERAGNPVSYDVDPGLCPGCHLPSCECEPDLF